MSATPILAADVFHAWVILWFVIVGAACLVGIVWHELKRPRTNRRRKDYITWDP